MYLSLCMFVCIDMLIALPLSSEFTIISCLFYNFVSTNCIQFIWDDNCSGQTTVSKYAFNLLFW